MTEFTSVEEFVDWVKDSYPHLISDECDSGICLEWSNKKLEIWGSPKMKYHLDGSQLHKRGVTTKIRISEIDDEIDNFEQIDSNSLMTEEKLITLEGDNEVSTSFA